MKNIIFLFFCAVFSVTAQTNMNPMDSTDYTQRNNLTHPGYNNGVYYFVNDQGKIELAAPRLFLDVNSMREPWTPMPGVMYTLHQRGLEGAFRLSMRDTTSADDGVNVILTGYGQRMKRVGNIVMSANLLNRANHTGTQLASTIADFTTTARSVISATSPLSYNASTGVISYAAPVLATVATTGNYNDLTNKPVIPPAFSGNYSDLSGRPDLNLYYLASNPNGYVTASALTWTNISGKPTIPAAQIQSDWTQGNSAALDFIKNKPTLAAVATTGAYSSLTGTPLLSTVATTGSYLDLSNRPTIPAAQIQSDWNQTTTTALDFIKNKPSLTWTTISGKPTFATVATTGSYVDLTNKPTIPAAQIQSDWSQTNTASADFIKNKPQINTPVSNNVTRSLNTSFQISTTRGAFVTYSVKITATITLVVGQTTTVFLETSPDGTTWTSMQNNEFGVNAGIALTMSSTVGVSGFVPQGYFVRIRTSGTATAVYSSGNETLL